MRAHEPRNLVVPGALAVLAATLTLVYATSRTTSQPAAASTAHRVYVATRDFPAGAAGDDVVRSLKLVRVGADAVVPSAVTAPAQLAGRVVVAPIFQGQQVTLRAFAGVRDQGVAGAVTGRLRALQIAGDANQLLAGTLRAHDRVDVLASLEVGRDRAPRGRIVLRDVLVLKAPGSTAATDAQHPYSVTLALTDAQAQTLFFVSKNGDWSLMLRPVVHAADSPDFTDSAQSVLTEGR